MNRPTSQCSNSSSDEETSLLVVHRSTPLLTPEPVTPEPLVTVGKDEDVFKVISEVSSTSEMGTPQPPNTLLIEMVIAGSSEEAPAPAIPRKPESNEVVNATIGNSSGEFWFVYNHQLNTVTSKIVASNGDGADDSEPIEIYDSSLDSDDDSSAKEKSDDDTEKNLNNITREKHVDSSTSRDDSGAESSDEESG